jgi:hypothetical protein
MRMSDHAPAYGCLIVILAFVGLVLICGGH